MLPEQDSDILSIGKLLNTASIRKARLTFCQEDNFGRYLEVSVSPFELLFWVFFCILSAVPTENAAKCVTQRKNSHCLNVMSHVHKEISRN